ncbi:D-glycero-beta-D-manno-heptose 1-phosphate adenylyltransferase [Anaerocolumna jejuensis]|uniref:D-glycero-beta-D-manno-heptose 1-phosphate adenylyltransferase n=1 Tax=Anaerocolumna jejuensis TaxID=259063 RepID=UPI003F7BEF9D
MMKKIVNHEELKKILSNLKNQGKTILSTSGCFDIVHAGHVRYLEEAKKFGDVLVVMLNTDFSVKSLKGPERPIVNEEDRAIVMAGLESVDYVCLFDELTPCRLISELRPDIVVKGGDYQGKHIPEMDTVAEYGGRVEYVLMVEGHSTTNIIHKIEEQIRRNLL